MEPILEPEQARDEARIKPWLWENFKDVPLRIVAGKVIVGKLCHHCGQIFSSNPAACNSHLQKHVREKLKAQGAKP